MKGIDKPIAITLLVLVIIFFVFILAQSSNLNKPVDSFDEGWRLMAAKLIALDYKPYTEVYHVDPPLYPLATGGIVWVTSLINNEWLNSPLPVRILSLFMALVGAGAIFLLAKTLYNSVIVGGVAAFVLLFTPLYFELARRGLPEMPAIAMGIVAVWLVAMYMTRRQLRWLLLGGIAFGLSLVFKLIFPFLGILLIVMLIEWDGSAQDKEDSNRFTLYWGKARINTVEVLYLGLAVLLPVVILIFLSDVKAMVEQAWAFHIAGRSYYPIYDDMLLRFGRNNLALVLSIFCAFFLLRKRRGWIPMAWLGLGLLMLAFQAPVRYRYTVILLPPLALFAGLFVQLLVEALKQPGRRKQYWVIVPGLIFVGWYLFSLPTLWRTNLRETALDVKFIQTIDDLKIMLSQADQKSDFIVSDEPALVFYINKLIPPPIAELSKKRVEAGFIDLAEVNRVASIYHEAPVLTRTNNSHLQRVDGFEQWVQSNYLHRTDISSPDRDLTLYYASILNSDCSPDLGSEQKQQFWQYRCAQVEAGDQIRWISSRFGPEQVKPGESITLVLDLKLMSAENLNGNLKAFVHLLDDQSQVVAQADHVLFHNALESIPLGVMLADQNSLDIPQELPAGTYSLAAGFYRADTMERLPLAGVDKDALVIGRVIVQ